MISAADRSTRWKACITITTVMLTPCFIQMAQADVSTQLLFQVLSRSPAAIGPTPDTEAFSQSIAVNQVLQQLVRKPDGSFDTPYAIRLGFDLLPTDVETAVQQANSAFPIAIFQVGLKRLQQFQPMHPVFGDPLRLLAADVNWLVSLPSPLPQTPIPARYLFAITAKDPRTGEKAVMSSIRLRANLSIGGPTLTTLDFAIERVGSSMLARQVDKWRRIPTSPREIDPNYFLVSVPALGRYYLGIIQGQELTLTAIVDDHQVGLNEGEKDKAAEVFRKLKAEALTINPDNPDAPPR